MIITRLKDLEFMNFKIVTILQKVLPQHKVYRQQVANRSRQFI